MIAKAKVQMESKEDLKTVALGTSKINYMDPRISVSTELSGTAARATGAAVHVCCGEVLAAALLSDIKGTTSMHRTRMYRSLCCSTLSRVSELHGCMCILHLGISMPKPRLGLKGQSYSYAYFVPQIAWCKRNEMPIERIFNKSLLSKFYWAMDADWEFKF